MKTYREFHDGFFEGLWIDGKRVHVFLATTDMERFTIVADGVAGLNVEGLQKGNIILDIVAKTHGEWSDQDVATLPELRMIDSSKPNVPLARARQHELMVLEINPSYGGSCLMLAKSFNLLCRKEWLERNLLASR
ncbi:MAG: hypothetical protein WCC37_16685 [Candidatus Sulfotelmatobacter sp.]|jgi:hypothetical protein